MLTADQIAQLQSTTTSRGQLLTSKYKQPVYLPRQPCDDALCGWVWKGPFSADESRLVMTRWRTACFELMGTPVSAPTFINDETGAVWMRFTNLGTTDPTKWSTKTVTGKCEGCEVTIVDRESTGVKQVLHTNKNSIIEHLFGKGRLLFAYIDAALLATGDMGLWNALVGSDGRPVIIDYSDCSHRKNITSWTALFAKTTRELEQLFEEHIPNLTDAIREHIVARQKQIATLRKLAEEHKVEKIFKRYKIVWSPETVVRDILALLGNNLILL